MSRDILPEHPAELTLLDYLVGHLPPDVSDQIRRHVSSCRACRRTIAELSLTVDELDRLPTVPIPHDALGDSAGRRPRRAGRFLRFLPAVVLVGAAGTVLATFRLGGDTSPPRTNQVVVHTTSSDPRAAVDGMLSGILHRVVLDAGNPNHMIVEVSDRDVRAAAERLVPEADQDGPAYTVDIGGFGAAPSAGPFD